MFSASSLDRCTTGLLIYDGTTLRAAGNRTVLITVYTTALEAWVYKPYSAEIAFTTPSPWDLETSQMNPEFLVGSGKHPGSSTGVKEPHNHECDPVRCKLSPTQLWPDFISATTLVRAVIQELQLDLSLCCRKKTTCPEENSPVGLNTKGNRDVQPGMHIFISISSSLIHYFNAISLLLAPCTPLFHAQQRWVCSVGVWMDRHQLHKGRKSDL